MDRVERMHWRLLVEMGWEPELGGLAHNPIPSHLEGQARIDYYKARESAQRRITAFFPEDEPDGIS